MFCDAIHLISDNSTETYVISKKLNIGKIPKIDYTRFYIRWRRSQSQNEAI